MEKLMDDPKFKNKKKPQQWINVYPQGTKEGDEEQALFIALVRNQIPWRSVAALAKESNLTEKRVEQILEKYDKLGMVFQNPTTEDQWGYWTRLPDMLPDIKESLVLKDHKNRIKRLKQKD